MALTAISYAGAVSAPVRSKGLEVYNALRTGKGVTLTHIWGKGASGDHAKGIALDFMIFENAAAGHYIANYLMANAKRLGVQYLMWNHRIWNVDKDKYGAWRWVADRGSVTENHMDHVHVTLKSSSTAYVPPSPVVAKPSPTKPTSPKKPAPPKTPKYPGKQLRRGSSGANVLAVQKRLKARGWSLSTDSKFGPGTERVVRQFQANKKLKADGIVGPATWAALWALPIT